MGEFRYENQGTYTYFVYSVSQDDVIDSMSLGMLTNNKIPGLANAIFTQMDANKYIKYNVTSKISVKQFFGSQVNKKRLIGVFSGIVDAMISAEEYMIQPNSILLDTEYIFADVSTCDTVLICLPVITEQEEAIDLSSFFKKIMFSTQFDQTENCDHVAKIINYLNSTPVFSLIEFKKILDNLKNDKASEMAEVQIKKQPVVQPKVTQNPNNVKAYQPIQASPIPNVDAQKVSETKSTNIGNNNVTPAVSKPLINNKQVTNNVNNKADNNAEVSEKKISTFDLLMHYSKEKAELYKKQKANKKDKQDIQTSKKVEPQKSNVCKTKPSEVKFAVPGSSQTNVGFAVPGKPTPPVTPTPEPQKQQISTAPVSYVQNTSQQNIKANIPVYTPTVQPQGQSMNFGETTVLGGGNIGETTVLSAASQSQNVTPYLMRNKNNEKIPLNKPVFRIGKERSYVDYFIGDNPAISRSHVNIISRDGEFFVMDTNSTNHTFVNGNMIQSNSEMKLNHGDKVRLANEDFDFKLY